MNKYRRKYTDGELLGFIHRFHDKYGHAPSKKEFDRQANGPSPTTLRKRFGSFNGAISAAGFAPKDMRVKIPEAELLDKLRLFSRSLGRTPRARDFEYCRPENVPCYETYLLAFGSLQFAVRSAGLTTSDPSKSILERLLIRFVFRSSRFFHGFSRGGVR